MIYFSSDHHFDHDKVIGYCQRPFEDVEQMNEGLIARHNEIVTDEDDVFILGDFCFAGAKRAREHLKRMNGNIIRIKGNHDKNGLASSAFKSGKIEYGGMEITLVHKPEHYSGKLTFCGHMHKEWKYQNWNGQNVIINCGVDQWDYRPVSIDTLIKFYNQILKTGNVLRSGVRMDE